MYVNKAKKKKKKNNLFIIVFNKKGNDIVIQSLHLFPGLD